MVTDKKLPAGTHTAENAPWVERIDQLKERVGHSSDMQLAADLLISRQFLSDIRSGKSPIPVGLKFKIADRLGYEMTRDALLELLPDQVANAIRKKDHQRSQRRKPIDDSIKDKGSDADHKD